MITVSVPNDLSHHLKYRGAAQLEEGRIYHLMLQRINPETGNLYTMKEAAQEVGVHYSTFRNREALWHPYQVVETDSQGNLIRRKGLTDAERELVRTGQLLPTYASRLSLGESTRNISKNKGFRATKKAKAMSLREMEDLFDITPADQIERRLALAQCMGKSLEQAIMESRARIDEAMERLETAMKIRKNRRHHREKVGRN